MRATGEFTKSRSCGSGRPAMARPMGLVRSSASVSDTNPNPRWLAFWFRHALPLTLTLNILQLVFVQPEIVTQFVDDRQADLFADFDLAGAHRLDILLIKHDVIGS
jgi:hypothetical protein